MPDLESAYGGPGGRRVVRLSVAVGLVLAGATVVAAGVGGLVRAAVPGASPAAGLAAAVLFLPLVLASAILVLPATTGQRGAGLAGGALATLGVVASWVAGAATPAWAPLPLPALVGGLAGIALAVGGLVAAVGTAGFERSGTDGDLPGYVSRPGAGARSHGGLPADGGTDEDDLQFPLDEE